MLYIKLLRILIGALFMSLRGKTGNLCIMVRPMLRDLKIFVTFVM